jgi:A/G-specific adenine glycosylase
MTIKKFIATINAYFVSHRRDLAWRNTSDPYHILVSEMMLQQTQVARCIIKYQEFIDAFPTLDALAHASMLDVLAVWKGLGYNRRAYFLKSIAEQVTHTMGGVFPALYDEQIRLPGIGQSTAGALQAFAFGKKYPFIETNIRTVYLHFFFGENNARTHARRTSNSTTPTSTPTTASASTTVSPTGTVSDSEITSLLIKTLAHIDEKEVKDFYYALYDYGAMLKQSLGKKSTELHQKSTHYKKQSTFKGSTRQLRALILHHILISQKKITESKDTSLLRSSVTPTTSTRRAHKLLSHASIVTHFKDQIMNGEIPFNIPSAGEDSTDDSIEELITKCIEGILDDLEKKHQIKKIVTGRSVFYNI